MVITAVPVEELPARLNISAKLEYPESSRNKPLHRWRMEEDDSPIFRFIYRNFKPRRHLEFGTWKGTGALYCLEECDATVWTINLPAGEKDEKGTWAYPQQRSENRFQRLFLRRSPPRPSDEIGSIGQYYLEAGLGGRVCQIYCDSREWDIRNYSEGFFDTVLIDGGHTEDIVTNDTRKACQLTRSGGIMMWHDFCEDIDVKHNCSSPEGVVRSIYKNRDWLETQMKDLFWIKPSWILLGVKR